MSSDSRNRGFTLVEISIVLTIVGLMVGGIMIGQEMIRSAEVRATMTQIERMETAVNSFRLKYGCLPGDCNTASSFGFSPTPLSEAAPVPGNNGYNPFNPISAAYAGGKKGDDEGDLKPIEKEDEKGGGTEPEKEPEKEGDDTVGPNSNQDGKITTPEEAMMAFDQLNQSGLFGSSNNTHVYLPVNIGGANGKVFWTIEYRNANGNYLVPVTVAPAYSATYYAYNNLIAGVAYGLDQKRDDAGPVTGKAQALTAGGVRVAGGDKGASACVSTADTYNTRLGGPLCGIELKTTF